MGRRRGTNGVSTNGVAANFVFFDGGTFWVPLLIYFIFPKVPGRTPSSPISQNSLLLQRPRWRRPRLSATKDGRSIDLQQHGVTDLQQHEVSGLRPSADRNHIYIYVYTLVYIYIYTHACICFIHNNTNNTNDDNHCSGRTSPKNLSWGPVEVETLYMHITCND